MSLWGFSMSDIPSRRPCRSTASYVLFGLMAPPTNFTSPGVPLAAVGAWIAYRSQPLDQLLLDQGHLDADCHPLLIGLVRQLLKLHNDDPEKSLKDLGANGSALHRLLGQGDSELHATLDR